MLQLSTGSVWDAISKFSSATFVCWGHRGRDRMVVEFTTTYALSAYLSITTDVVSSNFHQGEVYNIMW